MTTQQITELFSNLTDYKRTAEVLTGIARKHRVTDDDLLTFLHDIKIHFDQKFSGQQLENPDGYLVTTVKNRILKQYKTRKREVPTEYMAQVPDQWIEQFETGGRSTIQKINDLFQLLEPTLPPKPKQLLSIMVELATGDYPSYEHYIHAVKSQARENGISDAYFYKLCERLRIRMKSFKENAIDLLYTVVRSDDQKIVEFIINSEGFAFQDNDVCLCTDLAKIELSDEEVNGAKWLQMLAKDNGFDENTINLPPIYYDTYDNVEFICPECIPIYDEKDERNPDALGVYCQFGTNAKANSETLFSVQIKDNGEFRNHIELSVSKEGIIVLFKDRIEKYCNYEKEKIQMCRYLVLMHELGHWLSHWPTVNRENWKLGYYGSDYNDKPLPNESFIKEGFAQLIAYWSTDEKSEYREYFKKYLTPKHPESPYKYYEQLLEKNKADVFHKIIQIRKYAGISSDLAKEFLESDENDLKKHFATWLYNQAISYGIDVYLFTLNDFLKTELLALLRFRDDMKDPENQISFIATHNEISKTHQLCFPNFDVEKNVGSGASLIKRFGGL